MNNFQGQILILMGDWRQCPPVIPNGDMYEIVNASMIFSQFWKLLCPYHRQKKIEKERRIEEKIN
jgi:hypothetical protein